MCEVLLIQRARAIEVVTAVTASKLLGLMHVMLLALWSSDDRHVSLLAFYCADHAAAAGM
jgi:hypothetical protein